MFDQTLEMFDQTSEMFDQTLEMFDQTGTKNVWKTGQTCLTRPDKERNYLGGRPTCRPERGRARGADVGSGGDLRRPRDLREALQRRFP